MREEFGWNKLKDSGHQRPDDSADDCRSKLESDLIGSGLPHLYRKCSMIYAFMHAYYLQAISLHIINDTSIVSGFSTGNLHHAPNLTKSFLSPVRNARLD